MTVGEAIEALAKAFPDLSTSVHVNVTRTAGKGFDAKVRVEFQAVVHHVKSSCQIYNGPSLEYVIEAALSAKEPPTVDEADAATVDLVGT